ncbi:uncharacterized protein ARB_07800 [Trichophyton benhamiae CBS 112371]|uniref:Uncharacterized protein n=1 Tax=Arthroderma benhamiae (strain ATCC MYA-4681 / CBS 112371) TaxID=663331 RepID=D4ATY7_ARTBC|nr:uncharacterized protein ARB_07800 [Trichophyton benhamiae CBS 112371]EFE33440.1 hypothetical protein ARB_07800 [Trichophyton benhamiae CBS 112371]
MPGLPLHITFCLTMLLPLSDSTVDLYTVSSPQKEEEEGKKGPLVNGILMQSHSLAPLSLLSLSLIQQHSLESRFTPFGTIRLSLLSSSSQPPFFARAFVLSHTHTHTTHNHTCTSTYTLLLLLHRSGAFFPLIFTLIASCLR